MQVKMLFALLSFSLLSLFSETAMACAAQVNDTHQKNFLVAKAASYFEASLTQMKSVNVIGYETMIEEDNSSCSTYLSSWARVSLKWSADKTTLCSASVTVDAFQKMGESRSEGSVEEVDFVSPEFNCSKLKK